MANVCEFPLNVWGDDVEVRTLVAEVRRFRQDTGDGGHRLSLDSWGWPVGDGPAIDLLDACEETGRIAGTAAWSPPLAFLAELTRHRPLVVECVATIGNEEHQRWLASGGQCLHLLTVVADPKDGVVHRLEVGEAMGDRVSLAI